MASNLRRSRRTIGQRFLRTEQKLAAVQRRPVATRIGSRVIIPSNIAPNAIQLPALDSDVTQYIQSTANQKNAIYRQPDAPSGGSFYGIGDLWFDTDDDNKIYRNDTEGAAPNWVGFSLGDNALASLSADKITAGTIDASQITVSNIDAGNIVTGTLSSISIVGVTISIGAGSTVFKADSNGIYAGGATFGAAPFSVDLTGALTATSGSIAGLTISESAIYYGEGTFNNDNTAFYVSNTGSFSLGNKLSWDGSTLSIQGTLKFTDGTTPGTFDNGDALTAGTVGGLTISSSSIYIGTGTWNNANTPFYVDNTGKFSLEDKLSWDPTSNTLAVVGTVQSSTLVSSEYRTRTASDPGFGDYGAVAIVPQEFSGTAQSDSIRFYAGLSGETDSNTPSIRAGDNGSLQMSGGANGSDAQKIEFGTMINGATFNGPAYSLQYNNVNGGFYFRNIAYGAEASRPASTTAGNIYLSTS